jgi:hypothetical protein
MLELLKFIMSDFWVFLGTYLLWSLVLGSAAGLIAFTILIFKLPKD